MGETRRLRGAVIGLGNVAVHGHLPGWRQRSDAVIVAATDLHPARQAECRAALPDARWHDSIGQLITVTIAGNAAAFIASCAGLWSNPRHDDDARAVTP